MEVLEAVEAVEAVEVADIVVVSPGYHSARTEEIDEKTELVKLASLSEAVSHESPVKYP